VSVAKREQGLSEKGAVKLITSVDNERSCWVKSTGGATDPWDPKMYDLVIPMHQTSVTEAAVLIEEYLKGDILKPTAASLQAVEDNLLKARAAVALINEGHDVEVEACKGVVTVTVNKQVLMLSRLVDEIRGIVSKEQEVISVEVKIGKNYHQTNVYRKFDFDAPTKVLVIDDEREFAKTLSERLILRDMGSAVAHDGETALKLIADDAPEVLVLDLKMPGIDGIEVLRRVKETNPSIEVIILTGHGSATDRDTCLKLGAFDYLHKPVDIELLSRKLKEAKEKIHQSKSS
ncbi:MAG: response regulator, partial [Desulfobulbaceae bacterium]|nr:response regulator [Desulfobulbaceae bacterium]